MFFFFLHHTVLISNRLFCFCSRSRSAPLHMTPDSLEIAAIFPTYKRWSNDSGFNNYDETCGLFPPDFQHNNNNHQTTTTRFEDSLEPVMAMIHHDRKIWQNVPNISSIDYFRWAVQRRTGRRRTTRVLRRISTETRFPVDGRIMNNKKISLKKRTFFPSTVDDRRPHRWAFDVFGVAAGTQSKTRIQFVMHNVNDGRTRFVLFQRHVEKPRSLFFIFKIG